MRPAPNLKQAFMKASICPTEAGSGLESGGIVTKTTGLAAKRHNQMKEQEKEGFLACSKSGEHWGSFPKQCLPNHKIGKVLS